MYLLGSQELADLVSGEEGRPIFNWLDAAEPGEDDLFVSVISLGLVAQMIESLPIVDREPWRRVLARGRRALEERGSVIDVDMAIVDVWASSLRGEPLVEVDPETSIEYDLGEDERLVVATAIARNYSLVTRRTEPLDAIASRTTLTIVEP